MSLLTMATLTTLLAPLLVAPAPQPPGGHAQDASGAAALAAALAHGQQTMAALEAADACSQTAFLAGYASFLGLQEDLNVAEAKCANLTEPAEIHACEHAAAQAFEDGLDEVVAQFAARKAICSKLGGGPYDPDIDEGDFERPTFHPLFPFKPGTTWIYHEQTDEGLEVNVVTVTDETIEIDDVECTVVHDTVALDGELFEDTLDYFAADEDGNVWYFGEHTQTLEDGLVVSLDGTFTAEVDGAKAGIIMLATPTLDTTYRQEFLINEAEDVATVVALNETVTVPFGTFQHCLKTADYTALDPGVIEYKFYAPGIGMVLEDNPDTGTQVVLVSFTPGS